MSRDSIIKVKSFELSVRIVNLFKKIPNFSSVDFVAKQIMRSATSISALIRESEFAESRKDFVHKLYVSLKEANETLYWLELSGETEIISKENFESLHSDCIEIIKMLTASVKTIRKSLSKPNN